MWPLVVMIVGFGIVLAAIIGTIKGLFHRKSRIVILTIAILITGFPIILYTGDGVLALAILACYYALEYVTAQRKTAPWGIFSIAVLVMLLLTDTSYIKTYHGWTSITFPEAVPTITADVPNTKESPLSITQDAIWLRVDHAATGSYFAAHFYSDDHTVANPAYVDQLKTINAVYTVPQKISAKRISLVEKAGSKATGYFKAWAVYSWSDIPIFFLEWRAWIIIAAIADIVVCILKAIYVHKTYI